MQAAGRHTTAENSCRLKTFSPSPRKAGYRRSVPLYLRRWPVELCIKELKGVVGLGQHQVTKDAARVERSVAVALMAYRVLLRLRVKQSKPGSSWSAFTRKQELAWDWGARQLQRSAHQEARKEIRRQRTAEAPQLRLAA
jgi:hypothetical protein